MNGFSSYSYAATEDGLKNYVLKVFMKMGLGLLLTALVAYFGYQNILSGGIMYRLLLSGSNTIWLISFVQLAVCIALSAGLQRFSLQTANLLFFAYSALTGITFSILPLLFGITTVFNAFLFAALIFISCTVIGYTTKVDISRFSGLLMGGLISIFLLSLVSIWVPALREGLFISYLTVIVFIGLTAWDMQKIKVMYIQSADTPELSEKFAIYGALQLYLDYINLFISILRILGSRKR